MPRETAVVRRVACVAGASSSLRIDLAREFSPWFEISGDLVFLDARGCAALWNGETGFAEALARRAAEIGADVVVGIAGAKSSARLAALRARRPVPGERSAAPATRSQPATFLIPPGRDREWIADLPVEWLHPSGDAAIALRRWGVRTIGRLAEIPSGEVALRLGAEGARLHRAARGEEDEPIVPTPQPDEPEESVDLEHPLTEIEPLLFVLRGTIDRLAARLVERALVFGSVALRLTLERSWENDDTGVDDRVLEFAAPNADVASIVSLLRVSIESSPPRAPVTGLRVRATPSRTRTGQLSLFVPAGPSPQKLAVTLARLAALVGAERVGIPRRRDEHRSAAPQAVRVMRPPRPLATGTGTRMVGRRFSIEGDGSMAGRVVAASGPWRLRSGWWGEAPIDREYWDVELSSGPLLRIFREAATDAWFADGIYD